jgi:hypothetical protein
VLFGQRRSRSSLPVRIFAYIKPVETLSLRVRECSFLKRAPLPRPPPPSRRPRRRAPTPLALPHPRNAKRDSSRNGFTLRLARRASTHGGRRRWQWARPRRRCCSCSTWRPRNDRTLLTPFPHFYSPCSLTPPSSPYSSPLFIYGFTLFFVSLLFPPSTARAPLYWLFFYRFILYKYARSNSYTSYTKTEYTLRQGHRALLFAQSGEAGPHCWCCSLSVTRYSRSLERVRTREPPAILTTSSSTPR